VEDDFGRLGRSYRETFSATADRETTIRDLLSGQYNDPVRVVAFIDASFDQGPHILVHSLLDALVV
jgi:hypothetical protein